MGNKQRKINRKAAAAILRKTGGVPPVTLAVADPLRAFQLAIPAGTTSQISLNRAMQRIFKDVRLNRPQKGPLNKIKFHPKRRLMERLALKKEGDQIVLEILPGDPIATLDGKPYRKEFENDVKAEMENGVNEEN